MTYGLSALLFAFAVLAFAAFRAGWFDRVADRLGVRSATSADERRLPHADDAWRLVDDPSLWPLWMPGVAALRGAPRALRPGVRYDVALREARGPFVLQDAGTGHVVVEAYDGHSVLAWQLLAGQRVDRFRLERHGALVACTAEGRIAAATVLDQLERETAWAGEPDRA